MGCVALAALGAVLPGLPTTIFLILASYFFARSCPWLEERLLRNRLFAPYMAWVDGRERMPRRAKATAIGTMWLAVVTSLALLHAASQLQPWFAVAVLAAGVAGTFAIALDAAARMARARVTSQSRSR